MAKHLKKNNIISYDEAKQKIFQEKEDQKKRSAKHFHDDQFDDLENDSYVNDVPKQGKYSRGFRENQEDIDFSDRYNDKSRKPKYAANTKGKFTERSTPKYARKTEDVQEEYYEDEHPEGNARNYEGRIDDYTQRSGQTASNLNRYIAVGAMVVLLVFLIVMLYKMYAVETIKVEGNEEVKYHDITQLCGVEYKQSMFSIKEEEIIENFESQLPMIEVVEVKKTWPNILEIYVRERQPVCYIVLKGSQKCALIGKDNVCLAVQDSYLEGDMPIIYGLDVGTGELGKELLEGEARKLEVLKLIIDAMIESECISELESININNTTNIIMMSTTGTKIKIGDTTNLGVKFANTKIGIKRLISDNNTEVTMVVTGDNAIYIE